MTFLDNIDLLTIPTKTFIDTDDGKKLVERSGLLPELRRAVFAGMESGGSSSAFGSRPPIDAGARDLLDEIDTQAAEALHEIEARPTPLGEAEHYVRLWAAATTEFKTHTVTVSAQRTQAEMATGEHRKAAYRKPLQIQSWRLAQRWVDAIDLFFNPPSTSEIVGGCPSCEAERSHRFKDGEVTSSTALSFVHDTQGNSTEATCDACRASWSPEQFAWLLSTLAAAAAAKAAAKALADGDPETPTGFEPAPIPTITLRPSYCITCYQDGHTDYINLDGRCACDCH